MASWDAVTGAEEKRVGLRCLACGRRLEESLAVLGSLRCLDCRESNAALKESAHDTAGAFERSEGRNLFRPSPPS
jgi:hypothetical protein